MNAEIKNMTTEQITDLKAQIADWEKAKERKPLAWKPKCGDEYSSVDSFSCISHIRWDDDPFDKKALASGNCFETEELAKAELKRRQGVRQIEELVDKYDHERGGAFILHELNYTFRYVVSRDDIDIQNRSLSIPNPIAPTFSTEEVAQRILEEVGDENVKLLFTKYPIITEED